MDSTGGEDRQTVNSEQHVDSKPDFAAEALPANRRVEHATNHAQQTGHRTNKRVRHSFAKSGILAGKEREEVCNQIRDFDGKTLSNLMDVASNWVKKDWRCFLLGDKDVSRIIGLFSARMIQKRGHFLRADNPWALMKTVTGHCIYDHTRYWDVIVLVYFRKHARIRGLLSRLKLQKVRIESDVRDRHGKRTLKLRIQMGQYMKLKKDSRILNSRVLYRATKSSLLTRDTAADKLGNVELRQEVRQEILKRVSVLEREAVTEDEKRRIYIFKLSSIENIDMETVAIRLRLNVKSCQTALKKFHRLMARRFPELRKLLGGFEDDDEDNESEKSDRKS